MENATNETGSVSDPDCRLGDLLSNVAIFVFQLLAFAVVLLFGRVQTALKISLVCLIAPDFVNNCSWSAFRVSCIWFRGAPLNSDVECKLLLIVSHLSMLCSHSAITIINIKNYLAVMRPIFFNRWMTTWKMTIITLVSWCFCAVISITETMATVDSKRWCFRTPYCMTLTMNVVILATTITVAYLNVNLAIPFWGTCRICLGRSRNDSEKADNVVDSQNNEVTFSDIPSSSGVFSVSDNSNQFRDNTSQGVYPNNKSEIACKQVFSEDTTVGKTIKHQHRALRNHRRRSGTQARHRSLTITLIILTVWHSLGYLPFMTVKSMTAGQPEIGAPKTLSLLNTATNRIRRVCTFGNTFLYVWRFVRWRSVCASLNKRLGAHR